MMLSLILLRSQKRIHLLNTVLVGGQRLQILRGPPVAPPLPRPPPPPPMVLPPTLQGQTPQGPSQPIQHMAAAPQVGAQRTTQCLHDILFKMLSLCTG